MKPYVLILFLCITCWLAACGQLEFGIETKVTAGRPIVTTQVVATQVVTATGQPSATPMAVVTDLPTPTLMPTQTPTAVPTHSPTPRPQNPPPPTATATPAPQINRLTVSPLSVQPRDSLSISWDTRGEKAKLCVLQSSYLVHQYWECQDVPLSGTRTWLLDDALRNDFYVELQVTLGGQMATESVLVTVGCHNEADWWFFTPAPAICPAADATNSQAAIQRFEHGWMLWLAQPNTIYAFFEDGYYTAFYVPPALGTPEPGDGGVVAPAGFFAPVRGFGLVWRGETSGAQGGWVRNRLGWGLAPESGFQTQVQWDSFFYNAAMYVRDADGRIIVIDPSSSRWSIYNDIK